MRRNAKDYVRQRRGGRVDPAVLHLKIRVILTRPMTQDAALALMMEAAETGVVPDGIEVRWIDWEKGGSGRARSGRLTQDVAAALEAFYGAIASSGPTRFEPVSRPGGSQREEEDEDDEE